MGNKNSAKTILAQQRRLRVWQLRQQHYPMQEIANLVGITVARVSQIIAECVKELDGQALAAKNEYRKFLLAETEAAARRLNARLATLPPGDIQNAMRIEEQLRKNAELRAKLTAAEKIPLTPPPQEAAPLASVDVQRVLAEVDAWTPPVEREPLPLVTVTAHAVGGD